MKEHLINLTEAENDLALAAAYLAENIRNSDGHAEAMKEIVTYFAAQGAVDPAAELADTIKDNFTRDNLLVKIAGKCAEIGDDEYAFQLADAVEDYNLQTAARERIAVQKAVRGDFDEALKIAVELNHPDDALSAIAVCQISAGGGDESRRTISRIAYPAAKVQAWQAVAAALYEAKEVDKAEEFLAAAETAAREIELPEEKIRVLLAIAAQYIEARQFDKAIAALDQARAASEILDGAHREPFLSSASLDFLRAGSLDLADRTLDLIQDKTQIAATLTGFSAEFERRGECDDALETLEEAYAILKSQKDKEVRDSRIRFNLFGVIAAGFAGLGKIERAMEIALDNPSAEESNDALAQIAVICAGTEKSETARQAVNLIADENSRAFTLLKISDTRRRENADRDALDFLSEAHSFAANMDQPSTRSAMLNEIAKRFLKHGKPENARRVATESLHSVRQIADESFRAVAFLRLAEVFQTGEFELDEAEKRVVGALLEKASF